MGSVGPQGSVGYTGMTMYIPIYWPPVTGTTGTTGTITNADVIALATNFVLNPGSVYTHLTSDQIYPYDVAWAEPNNTIFFTDTITQTLAYTMNGDIAGSLNKGIVSNPRNVAYAGGILYVTSGNQVFSSQVTFGTSAITARPFNVFAGASSLGFTNNTRLQANFSSIQGIAIATDTTIYVSDTGNFAIRKIDPVTGSVTTLAGTGVSGFVNGQSNVAQFIRPTFLALDAGQSNLYISDSTAIRQIDLKYFNVSTVVGSATGTSTIVDGFGSFAQFSNVGGLVIDGTNTLYAVDTGTMALRRISYANNQYQCITISGKLSLSIADKTTITTGNLDLATFYTPNGLTIDSSSDMYIADTSHRSIRTITPSSFTASSLNINSISVGQIQTASARNGVIFSDASGTYYTSSTTFTYTDGILVVNGIALTSDARLKENIIPLSNSLSNLSTLNPVSYTRIDETTGKRHIGFLAQEVETVYPELIYTDSKGSMSIAYQNLTAVLVDSVKELQGEVRNLQSTVRGMQECSNASRSVPRLGNA
jgi:streptogramin lyase